jgi:transcriptional regulator with XRE-family HTH domain
MSNQADIFIEWLNQQEKLTGLSDYEISKRGGFSHSAISRVRTGITPGYEICARIAAVLNVSPTTVFRKAGLMSDATTDQVRLEDWDYLLSQLPAEEADELRRIALMKIEKRQNAENAARAAQFKPNKKGG